MRISLPVGRNATLQGTPAHSADSLPLYAVIGCVFGGTRDVSERSRAAFRVRFAECDLSAAAILR